MGCLRSHLWINIVLSNLSSFAHFTNTMAPPYDLHSSTSDVELEDVDEHKLHSTFGALNKLSHDNVCSIMHEVPAHTPPRGRVGTRYQQTASHCAWWRFELIAAGVAIAGIISLAAVLRVFDDKPQQDHPLFRSQTYNLNTIVAGIATITRYALGVVLGSAMSQCMWNRFATRDGTVRHFTDLTAFDEASRGAWGSAKLIWLLRGT